MDIKQVAGTTLFRKAGKELKEFAILSLYLYVCFGAILLYTSAALQAHGIDYEPYGFAAIKALILAKFMLIGNMLRLDKVLEHKRLIYETLSRSLIYLAFLVVLSMLEEVIAGFVHGRSAAESLAEIGGGTGLQIIATSFLLWLILIPVVMVQQLIKVLGENQLYRIFFDKQRNSFLNNPSTERPTPLMRNGRR